MRCEDVRSLLLPFLHGELDGPTGDHLRAHCSNCSACERLLTFESAFEARLRSIPSQAAPLGLSARIAGQWRRRRWRSTIRAAARPVLWAASGALAAALVLFFTRLRVVQPAPSSGDMVATVVCLGCTLRPETIPMHAQDRGHDHVNGLQDEAGNLWHILDTPQHRALLVDDRWIRRRVRAKGRFFRNSLTVDLAALEPFDPADGAPSTSQILRPKPAGAFALVRASAAAEGF
jgi:hypothetical protein